MKKVQILMIVLAIALTFPTLVLAARPAAPSQEEACYYWDGGEDCLVKLSCVFRATYDKEYWVCCENGVCRSGSTRTFAHCGC